MKDLLDKIYLPIILPAMFALMAWIDYRSDGDRVNLAFAVVLIVITLRSIYFAFSINQKTPSTNHGVARPHS
jgi:membrane protein insertase Oxa1/YidC/SpoIIIJ